MLTILVDKIRQFHMDPSRGVKPNDQFMPPPRMSSHTMPLNWGWHQNPNIYTDFDPETGNAILVNKSAPLSTKVKYLPHDVPKVPDSCPEALPKDPGLRSLIALMQEAFEERPIWTRRAMVNRISHSPHLHNVRHAFQFVSYQFKTGAWREAAIKLGFDPRKDPKCRIYQTVFFKTSGDEERQTGQRSETWQEKRSRDGRMDISRRERTDKENSSHIFDGKSVMVEGKVWQVCDITDPLLTQLIQEAPYPSTCDTKIDGWFPNGSWAKIKAVMRTKLIAIRIGKEISDEDFAISLAQSDFVSGKSSRGITVPVPELPLTDAEMENIKKAGLESSSFKKAKRLARRLGPGRVGTKGPNVTTPRKYNGRQSRSRSGRSVE
jgi:general transcription factor 3C polypeptide 5 (transcription factor C subunit 1)